MVAKGLAKEAGSHIEALILTLFLEAKTFLRVFGSILLGFLFFFFFHQLKYFLSLD